jgi:muramoyltetrapeptide carboxypeptidase
MWGLGRVPSTYDLQEFKHVLMEGRLGKVPANGLRRNVHSGRAEGRLLGGNLRCLLKLAGTPYWPDFSGAILFIESYGFEPAYFDAMFHTLHQMRTFDQINGMLIGYIDGLDNQPDALLSVQDVLKNGIGEPAFPVLKACDFGHNCPNTMLPVGARVRIDADKTEIELLEAYLQG